VQITRDNFLHPRLDLSREKWRKFTKLLRKRKGFVVKRSVRGHEILQVKTKVRERAPPPPCPVTRTLNHRKSRHSSSQLLPPRCSLLFASPSLLFPFSPRGRRAIEFARARIPREFSLNGKPAEKPAAENRHVAGGCGAEQEFPAWCSPMLVA